MKKINVIEELSFKCPIQSLNRHAEMYLKFTPLDIELIETTSIVCDIKWAIKKVFDFISK